MLNSQADGQIGNRESGRSDQRRAARRDVQAQIRIERKVSKRSTPDKLYGNGVGIVIASRLPDIEGYVGCVKGRTASGKGGVQRSIGRRKRNRRSRRANPCVSLPIKTTLGPSTLASLQYQLMVVIHIVHVLSPPPQLLAGTIENALNQIAAV
jgi:hypothetical protein